jgi:hypothetical protein
MRTFRFDGPVDVNSHELELRRVQLVEVWGECITKGHVELNQSEDDRLPHICAGVFECL